MNWLLEGKEVTDVQQFGDKAIGFVYKITNTKTGKFYIGKKILESKINKPLTKKEQTEWSKPGRIPKKKLIIKESNWADYWGSSKPLLEDLKGGKTDFVREVIRVCYSKKELSYYETFYQFEYKVLHVDSYCENILGKFYRRDAQGPQS
jgi:serine/threonine protein kinase